MSLQNSINNVERWIKDSGERLEIMLVKDLEHLIRVARETQSVVVATTHDADQHNTFVDGLIADVESEPLKDFLKRLKE